LRPIDTADSLYVVDVLRLQPALYDTHTQFIYQQARVIMEVLWSSKCTVFVSSGILLARNARAKS